MPISTISQTISTIPEAGHRGVDVQATFVNKQEDFQDHLQGTTVSELNALKTQINTTVSGMNDAVTNVNTKANEADADALSASNSAGVATTKAGEASTSASQASASATKASQWADNNYNVEVEAGKYSAKHWSTVAQNTVNNKVNKVTSTDNAIVRFDGTTGNVQNSSIIIDDNGNIGSSGNVVLASGSKIQGDFSNGNNSLRTAIQTSTSNSATRLEILPNGSSTSSSVHVRNSQDAINSSLFALGITSTESQVNSAISGTGTYLPIAFYTNGAERMRINTNGNVGIGDSNPQYRLSINSATALGQNAGDSLSNISKYTNVGSNASYLKQITYRHTAGNTHDGTDERIQKVVDATPMGYIAFGNNNVKLGNGSGDALVVDGNRNVLLTAGTGGLGYGAGAGGTVTQLTSKSTAVTLNKPSGQIITSNSALGAGASVEFILNNTVFNTSADSLYVITGSYGYNYTVEAKQYNTAQFLIRVKNISAGSLSEPLEIKFVLIKGATA